MKQINFLFYCQASSYKNVYKAFHSEHLTNNLISNQTSSIAQKTKVPLHK